MENLARLLDVIDHAYSGPIAEEKEFDLKYLFGNV
jgi:hypothetical protein